MYHIIEIMEGGKTSAAIVPEEWLILGSENKYFWPGFGADSTWVKNRRKPGPNWNIYSFERIIKSTATYQKSISLLQKAEKDTGLSSSCLSDASDNARKRKPVSRRIRSPDCDENSTSPLRTPLRPATSQLNNSRKRARSRSPQGLPPAPQPPPKPLRIPRTPSPVRPVLRDLQSTELGPSAATNWASIRQMASSPSTTPPAFTDSITTRPTMSQPPLSAASSNDKLSTDLIIKMLPAFFERTFKYFEDVKAAIESLHRMIERLEARNGQSNVASSQETPALPDGFLFPLSEVTKLQQLNHALAEEFTKQRMVLYLSNLGGEAAKDALYRILKQVFEPQLSILYSMEGRKGKLRFNNLKHLKSTIYEAMQRQFTDLNVSILDKYTGDWLAMSSDRAGGRRKREEEKKKRLISQSCQEPISLHRNENNTSFSRQHQTWTTTCDQQSTDFHCTADEKQEISRDQEEGAEQLETHAVKKEAEMEVSPPHFFPHQWTVKRKEKSSNEVRLLQPECEPQSSSTWEYSQYSVTDSQNHINLINPGYVKKEPEDFDTSSHAEPVTQISNHSSGINTKAEILKPKSEEVPFLDTEPVTQISNHSSGINTRAEILKPKSEEVPFLDIFY